MKFLIVFALVFVTVWAKDLYSRSIENPVLEKEGRITNGKNALPGQFPYQVGINFNKTTQFTWCGGSLISRSWILTAALCIDGSVWGMTYLGATERLVAETFYKVLRSDMEMHPHFNVLTLKNDIGLMRISITSKTGTIGTVKFPIDDYDKYVGKLAVIAGWGRTGDEFKSLSNDLKYVTLKVASAYHCSKYYTHFYYSDKHMCVSTSDLMSPCQGDAGGPLVLEGEDLQIGLFSYTSNDSCERGIPAVFTRVGAYVDWIKSKIYYNPNRNQYLE